MQNRTLAMLPKSAVHGSWAKWELVFCSNNLWPNLQNTDPLPPLAQVLSVALVVPPLDLALGCPVGLAPDVKPICQVTQFVHITQLMKIHNVVTLQNTLWISQLWV